MKVRRPDLRLLSPLFLALALACAAKARGDEPPPTAPAVVAAGPDGSIFVADLVRPGVFRSDSRGRADWMVPGRSKPRTPFRVVTALAVGKDGVLFAADRSVGEVYRVEPGKDPVPLSGGAFEVPTGLALTPEGDLIVCDLRLGIVSRLPQGGGPPRTVARVPAPRGVALGNQGEIVVLSMGPDQLVRVHPDGSLQPIVKGKPFRFPLALVRDVERDCWLVSDGDARIVWVVSHAGETRPRIKGAPLERPEGLCLEPSGALLIADPRAGRIFRVTPQDAIQTWQPVP